MYHLLPPGVSSPNMLADALDRAPLLQRQYLAILPTGQRVRRVESRARLSLYSPRASSQDPRTLVFKCALAYTLALLGVYWPVLNAWLGRTDSKHLVATVAVYFHPARTKGSMHQLLLYASSLLCFSFAVSLGCRLLSAVLFARGLGLLSRLLDLLVLLALLGLLSYAKHKVNNPSFSTSASLASISLIACILKEGSANALAIPVERIKRTFQVVWLGCGISVACCYAVWPKSAVTELSLCLNDAYNAMLVALDNCMYSFLSDRPLLNEDAFVALSNCARLLLQYRDELKYELLLVGRHRQFHVLNEMVDHTIGLARHIDALRSSCEIKWELVKGLEAPHATRKRTARSTGLFSVFIVHLLPLIKSLCFTLKQVLAQVPFQDLLPFEPQLSSQNQLPSQTLPTDSPFVNTHLQQALSDAIALYQVKHQHALATVYAQQVFHDNGLHGADLAQQEKVAACCGNFSLLLGLYAAQLAQFCALAQQYPDACRTPRSWSWIKIPSFSSSAAFREEPALEPLHPPPPPLRYQIWQLLEVLKRSDIQFGLKVGCGALFLSVFAFLPATKHTFSVWRGEWTLTIYCIMMNKLEGATAMTAKGRFIGTLLGVLAAYYAWTWLHHNVHVLCLTGFVLSGVCFYFILFWKQNNAFGRFVLLTYNLTALYSYSMRERDGEDEWEGGDKPVIGEIGFHRFVAVLLGIVLALAMLQLVLRNSARARVKQCLSLLWLRLGMAWSASLLDVDFASRRCHGMTCQGELRGMLAECEQMVAHAPLEFRLKGSFPASQYRELWQATLRIANSMENMSRMILAKSAVSANEAYVLQYIRQERRDVEQRIYMMFYMVALLMRMGMGVPEVAGSTGPAMERMLVKLNRVRRAFEVKLSDDDFVLLYTYILVSQTITRELDVIRTILELLWGPVTAYNLQWV